MHTTSCLDQLHCTIHGGACSKTTSGNNIQSHLVTFCYMIDLTSCVAKVQYCQVMQHIWMGDFTFIT